MSADVLCEWDAVSGVDGYNIYLSDDGGSTYTRQNASLITGTQYTLTDVPAGSYTAYVTSKEGSYESVPSNTDTFTIVEASNVTSSGDIAIGGQARIVVRDGPNGSTVFDGIPSGAGTGTSPIVLFLDNEDLIMLNETRDVEKYYSSNGYSQVDEETFNYFADDRGTRGACIDKDENVIVAMNNNVVKLDGSDLSLITSISRSLPGTAQVAADLFGDYYITDGSDLVKISGDLSSANVVFTDPNGDTLERVDIFRNGEDIVVSSSGNNIFKVASDGTQLQSATGYDVTDLSVMYDDTVAVATSTNLYILSNDLQTENESTSVSPAPVGIESLTNGGLALQNSNNNGTQELQYWTKSPLTEENSYNHSWDVVTDVAAHPSRKF